MSDKDKIVIFVLKNSPLGWPAPCCLEIIGNIHDNPELKENKNEILS